MAKSFGEALKAIREENDWTLVDMAKKLGTTKQALSRYERGERLPKISVVAQFAEALGVPLEQLAGVEEKQNVSFVIMPPQRLDAGLSPALQWKIHPELYQMPPGFCKEDAEMEGLWKKASLTAKRAAIAVLKSMETEEQKP